MWFFQFMLAAGSLSFMAWCPFLYPEAIARRTVLEHPPTQLCAFKRAVTIYGEIFPATKDGGNWQIPCSHVEWQTDV